MLWLLQTSYIKHIFHKIMVGDTQFATQQQKFFARATVGISLVTTALSAIFSAVYYYLGSNPISISLAVLATILILTTPMHSRGKTRLAGFIVYPVGCVVMTIVIANLGGIASPSVVWLLGVAPGIAALLFRSIKGIILGSLFTIPLYFLVFVAEINGYKTIHLGFAPGSFSAQVYVFVSYVVLLLFIMANLTVFAVNEKRLFEQLMDSKERLQKATANLNAIFNSINQAIFLLNKKLEISGETSAHFATILGPDVDSLESFLEKCQISADLKAQIVGALTAIMGEDPIAFDCNEFLLPRQIAFQQKNQATQQILSLTWSPIVDGYVIRDVLVEIQDVTSLFEAQKAMKDSTERSYLLSALLQNKPQLLPTMVRDFTRLEQRLELQLQEGFVNIQAFKSLIHTLKGNARSAHLLQISDDCHAIEDALTAQNRIVDLNRFLNTETLSLMRQLQQFRQIYQEVLGSYQYRQGFIEIDSIKYQRLIHHIASGSPPAEVLGFLKEQLPFSLAKLADRVDIESKAIAKELGKPLPLIEVNDRSLVFLEGSWSHLNNALAHIVRNALDHGIETAAIRLAKQKPAEGRLQLRAYHDSAGFELHIEDDGAGLNLLKIREKSKAKGLQVWDDLQLAELIFAADFSTSAAVTIVSGRGEGLTAARAEIRELGGNIRLEFIGPEREGFRAFRLILHWPEALSAESSFDRSA